MKDPLLLTALLVTRDQTVGRARLEVVNNFQSEAQAGQVMDKEPPAEATERTGFGRRIPTGAEARLVLQPFTAVTS